MNPKQWEGPESAGSHFFGLESHQGGVGPHRGSEDLLMASFVLVSCLVNKLESKDHYQAEAQHWIWIWGNTLAKAWNTRGPRPQTPSMAMDR